MAHNRELIKQHLSEVKEKVPIENIIMGELYPYYADNYWFDGLRELEYTNVCKCPLHNEEEGSFRIFPNTNSCFCYGGCGGGDSIWLYREFNSKILNRFIKFDDAVEYLWHKYVEGQDVSKVTFSGPKKKELNSPVDSMMFLIDMVNSERYCKELPDTDKVVYTQFVDTLYRLVTTQNMKSQDAREELKEKVVKIKPLSKIQKKEVEVK